MSDDARIAQPAGPVEPTAGETCADRLARQQRQRRPRDERMHDAAQEINTAVHAARAER